MTKQLIDIHREVPDLMAANTVKTHYAHLSLSALHGLDAS